MFRISSGILVGIVFAAISSKTLFILKLQKILFVFFIYRHSYFTPLLNLARSIDKIMAYILVHIMTC